MGSFSDMLEIHRMNVKAFSLSVGDKKDQQLYHLILIHTKKSKSSEFPVLLEYLICNFNYHEICWRFP